MTEHDSPLAARARATLDQEAAELDAATLRSLRLARERALDATPAPSARWPVWVGAAAASVVVVGLVLQFRGTGLSDATSVAPESVIADLDVLTQDDDLGLIEDLEFLAWLSDADEDVT